MNNIIKLLIKFSVLFVVFGSIYFIIEALYKGHLTDYRMFIMAGIVGILIGLINNLFSFKTSFILQCLVGMLIVVLGEGICGYQWNIIEHLAIWDYNNLPGSFIGGQVNIIFAAIWACLSAICIMLDDWIRWKFFNEEKPNYTLKGRE